jgi:hypothetical protein
MRDDQEVDGGEVGGRASSGRVRGAGRVRELGVVAWRDHRPVLALLAGLVVGMLAIATWTVPASQSRARVDALRAARQDLADTRDVVEELETDLRATRTDLDAMAADLDDEQATSVRLRGDVEDEQARAEAAEDERDALADERDALADDLAALQGQVDDLDAAAAEAALSFLPTIATAIWATIPADQPAVGRTLTPADLQQIGATAAGIIVTEAVVHTQASWACVQLEVLRAGTYFSDRPEPTLPPTAMVEGECTAPPPDQLTLAAAQQVLEAAARAVLDAYLSQETDLTGPDAALDQALAALETDFTPPEGTPRWVEALDTLRMHEGVLATNDGEWITEAAVATFADLGVPAGVDIISGGSLRVAGTAVPGESVRPGTYVAYDVDGCYWERLDAAGEIIDNNFVNAAPQVQVTIRGSDFAFNSERCGPFIGT